MHVPKELAAPWLLLVFSLPAQAASRRVEIWRKLQRYGTVALRTSGNILPNTSANQERMEWLAAAIRSYKGQASVVLVQSFDDLSDQQLKQLFNEARSRDYRKVIHELNKVLASAPATRPAGTVNRIRRRFVEITGIDFFGNSLRSRVEHLLSRLDERDKTSTARNHKGRKIFEPPVDYSSATGY